MPKRTVYGWVIPDASDGFELTPEREREAVIRSLAGPYPGPNRRAIAEIITDRLIAIRDEADAAVGAPEEAEK